MYDLAIVGLGPAGLEACEIAIKNNLKVIAFEQAELGGTCLNQGCIPTKAIMHCANLIKELKDADKLGIQLFSAPNFSWHKILERKTEIVSKFNKVLEPSLKRNITLIKAHAEICVIDNEIQISADDNYYQAKNIIIASGSKPVELKGLEFDHEFILSSDDIYNISKLPKSIAIVGSGAIGLEWAMIFSMLGVNVKLIEKASVIAPLCDIDVQKRIERILKSNNIEFYKDDFITETKNNTVTLNSSKTFDVDLILSCVGRRPVIPEILISGCKENFKLKIYEDFSTDFDNLYVIGDANSEIMLAHAGSYQAKCVMKKILFNKPVIKKPVPSVIYTLPEVASVGLREQDIKNKDEYIIKKTLITSIAKSWCDNAADGLVKVIIKDNLIQGAHVVSKDADLLISMFNILIDRKIPIDEIDDIIFPHPSFAEIVSEVLKNGR